MIVIRTGGTEHDHNWLCGWPQLKFREGTGKPLHSNVLYTVVCAQFNCIENGSGVSASLAVECSFIPRVVVEERKGFEETHNYVLTFVLI